MLATAHGACACATQGLESGKREEGEQAQAHSPPTKPVATQFTHDPAPQQQHAHAPMLSRALTVWNRRHSTQVYACTTPPPTRRHSQHPPWMPPPGSWPRHTRHPLGWTQSGHAVGRTECAGLSPPAHPRREGEWGRGGGGAHMRVCVCECVCALDSVRATGVC